MSVQTPGRVQAALPTLQLLRTVRVLADRARAAAVEKTLDCGEPTAAVLIRPVSVAEIERTAREGLLMPPKSTFFTPKLKTGAVLRPLVP